MRLPHMKYNDSITKQTQIKFGGYNHTLNASEGDIYDMRNISSRHYPLISPREKRAKVTGVKTIQWRGTGWTWSGATLTVPTTIKVGLSSGDMVSIEGNDVINGDYVIKSIEYEWNEDDESIPTKAKITFHNADFNIESSEDEISVIKSKICKGTNSTTEESQEYLLENTAGEEITYTYEGNKLTKRTVTKTLEGVYYLRKTKTENLTYTYGDEVLNTYTASRATAENGIIKSDMEEWENIEDLSKVYVSGFDEEDLAFNGLHTVIYEWWGTNTDGLRYIDMEKRGTSEWDGNITVDDYGPPMESAELIKEEYIYYTENSSVDKVLEGYVCSGGVLQSGVRTTISPADAPSYLIKTVITIETVEHQEDIPHKITAIAGGDKLYYTTSDGSFYYDNVLCGEGLQDGEKQFAQTGEFIYILPDNCYFNKTEKTLKRLQAVTASTNKMGKLYIYSDLSSFRFYSEEAVTKIFNIGDTVSINVYLRSKGAAKAVKGIISEIEYNYEYKKCEIDFTEAVFKEFDREDIYKIIISEGVPELKYICAGNNRIWGCDGETIFCTAFGKPLEWFEYAASSDSNDADVSFAITPFDGFGEFTGCCFYDNTPMFFKENAVYKVYGSRASGFTLSTDEKPGVIKGAAKTLTVTNDMLFYLSPVGVMRYYGGSQKCLTDEFCEKFTKGVGGADSDKYYISMTSGEGYKLFVYDIKKGLWCVEDDTQVIDFVKHNNKLYFINSQNELMGLNYDKDMLSPFETSELVCEDNFDSEIEFGDYYMNNPNKKGLSKLFFRIGVEENSTLTLLINYDSESIEGKRVWQEVKTVGANAKRSYILPVIPKRCDHFRIKLKGHGGFVLHSMSYEYYVGTEL